jgi:hypothetical protein
MGVIPLLSDCVPQKRLFHQLCAEGYGLLGHCGCLGFSGGCNFVLEMDKATQQTQQTIASLLEDYLNAEYVYPKWAAAFAKDAKGDVHNLEHLSSY